MRMLRIFCSTPVVDEKRWELLKPRRLKWRYWSHGLGIGASIGVHDNFVLLARHFGKHNSLFGGQMRDRVFVNARVSDQLVGSAEALTTAKELARMWLFSCMSANVSCLMFQTVEGLIA